MSSLPTHMQAAVYHAARTLAVERWPLPELGSEQVLLEVSHCGICGTDLHLVMEGWGRPRSIGGHEYSGKIVALGDAVSGWQIGQAVVGGPEPGCGRCARCGEGRSNLCGERGTPGVAPFQGAFAEYKSVHHSQLVRVPDGVSLREAALAEPLAVALHGISVSGIRSGERAFVSGVGPIGMLTLAALRARGVEDVVVSEPSPARRERALDLGARLAFDPSELDDPPMPFEIIEDAVDAAFECSGTPSGFVTAIGRVRRAGTLVILGTGMARPPLDINRVLLNELTVTGAYEYDEDGFQQALALIASRKLRTDALIAPDDVALSDLFGAMQRLVAGEIAGKVMVAPRARV
jgi:(R,R)-butanediol dehydrogenase/meso-butanediol dehydrogenase/diacetyl reductase